MTRDPGTINIANCKIPPTQLSNHTGLKGEQYSLKRMQICKNKHNSTNALQCRTFTLSIQMEYYLFQTPFLFNIFLTVLRGVGWGWLKSLSIIILCSYYTSILTKSYNLFFNVLSSGKNCNYLTIRSTSEGTLSC